MNFVFSGQRIEINMPTRAALFTEIRQRWSGGSGFALATINLDHIDKLVHSPAFLEAYAQQDLVVADGRPITWMAALAKHPVELMPGSDLVLPLCKEAAAAAVSVALVGSSDDALKGAAEALALAIPGLKIVYTHAPAYGFDPSGDAARKIFAELDASGAQLCFIALGAPKQELFAAAGRALAPKVGFASVGAGIDFLSGHQVRAPRLMRALALEWLWRILQSPRRMLPRYARCIAVLPRQIWHAWKMRKSP